MEKSAFISICYLYYFSFTMSFMYNIRMCEICSGFCLTDMVTYMLFGFAYNLHEMFTKWF